MFALRTAGSAARSGGASAARLQHGACREYPRRDGHVGVARPPLDPTVEENRGVSYVFGHSDRELERLAAQAALVDPITREILVEAGIAPGMRVLDVGSGIGAVAFLVSSLVGEGGSVIG